MIKVYGHPRSGTHFIAATIANNFFNEKDYLKYYEKKSPHRMGNTIKQHSHIVYVKRNFEDVVKSIYKMKDRFGLNVNDFNVFLSTRYADMWVPDIDFKIKVNNRTKVTYRKDVSSHFRKIKMFPREYWEKHLASWVNTPATIVDYDEFQTDFKTSLEKLARDLKVKIVSFDRLEERVGWVPV